MSKNSIITKGARGRVVYITLTLRNINDIFCNFKHVFFDMFQKLIEEPNHEDYVKRLADYIRLMQYKYMFVRVEQPIGSLHFVLA